jgi:hypothetical protein
MTTKTNAAQIPQDQLSAIYNSRLEEVKSILNETLPGVFSILNTKNIYDTRPLQQADIIVANFNNATNPATKAILDNLDRSQKNEALYALVAVPFINKFGVTLSTQEVKDLPESLRDNPESFPLSSADLLYDGNYGQPKTLSGFHVSAEGNGAFSNRPNLVINPVLLTDDKNYSMFKETLSEFKNYTELFIAASASKNFVNIEVPLHTFAEFQRSGSGPEALYGGLVPHVRNPEQFGIIIDKPGSYNINDGLTDSKNHKNAAKYLGSAINNDKIKQAYKVAIADLFKDFGVKEGDVLITPYEGRLGHDFAKHDSVIRFDKKHMASPEFAAAIPSLLDKVPVLVDQVTKDIMLELTKQSTLARKLTDKGGYKQFSDSVPGYNEKGQVILTYKDTKDLAGAVGFIKTLLSTEAERLGATTAEGIKLQAFDLSKNFKIEPSEDKNSGRVTITRELAKVLIEADYKAAKDKQNENIIESLKTGKGQSK